MAYVENHWIQPAICDYCGKEFPIRYDDRMEKLRKEGRLFCSDECKIKRKEEEHGRDGRSKN